MCTITNKFLSFIFKKRRITKQIKQYIYYDTNGNVHHVTTVYTDFKNELDSTYHNIYRRQHYTDYIMLKLAEKKLLQLKSNVDKCYLIQQRIKANGDVTELINTKYYKGECE